MSQKNLFSSEADKIAYLRKQLDSRSESKDEDDFDQWWHINTYVNNGHLQGLKSSVMLCNFLNNWNAALSESIAEGTSCNSQLILRRSGKEYLLTRSLVDEEYYFNLTSFTLSANDLKAMLAVFARSKPYTNDDDYPIGW